MNKRITLTGSIGSGKTTVGNLLKEKTGYDIIVGGDIFRKLSQELGVSVLDINNIAKNDKSIDIKLDNYIKSLSESENIIIDSRLAWLLVNDSLKIYLYVDEYTAAQRIYSENRVTEGKFNNIGEVVESIKQRKQSESERYLDLYNVDIHDVSNYDLVIDTSNYTPSGIVSIITDDNRDFDMVINIDNLYPTQRLRETDEEIVKTYINKIKNGIQIEPIKATKYGDKFYVIEGHHRLIAYYLCGILDINVNYTKINPDLLEMRDLYDWEELLKTRYTL